jgi:hypothetical protein
VFALRTYVVCVVCAVWLFATVLLHTFRKLFYCFFVLFFVPVSLARSVSFAFANLFIFSAALEQRETMLLLLLGCVCLSCAAYSRAEVVTSTGCALAEFPKLKAAIVSTELNSFSNVKVVQKPEIEEAKIVFFGEEKEV